MDSNKARHKALRAARAVTLGLALATGGCFASHESARREPEPDPDPEPEPMPAGDASVPDEPDAAMIDAGLAHDAGSDAGMICDASGDWMEYEQCCNEHGWDFDWGCFAWGPFVPPSEVA